METGPIRLAHVQARLAQCFYLLSQSRLNHCWSLFGITAHLAMALGIHRKARVDPDPSSQLDRIELECGKRTFWCAYNMNTYLSAALGRPMTFHDGDIDQELPLCVDDEQLRFGLSAQPVVTGPSVLSATVAQIKYSSFLPHFQIICKSPSMLTKVFNADCPRYSLGFCELCTASIIPRQRIISSWLRPSRETSQTGARTYPISLTLEVTLPCL